MLILFSLVSAILLLTSVSAFAAPTTVEKIDLGYTVKNGSTGSTFLNLLQEVWINDNKNTMTFADVSSRYDAIYTLLNDLYTGTSGSTGHEGPCRVVKMNYPIKSVSMPGAIDAVHVQKIVYIAEVFETNNHPNTIKLSGAFVGVPKTVSMDQLETLIPLLLTESFGQIPDGSGGSVNRFVKLLFVGEKGIQKM